MHNCREHGPPTYQSPLTAAAVVVDDVCPPFAMRPIHQGLQEMWANFDADKAFSFSTNR